MKSLGITRDEAIELINEDKKVDKMTSSKQWESDLTPEQKKVSKQARQSGKTTVGQKIHREPKVDNDKRELINLLAETLQGNKADNVEIENPQKIITFTYNNRKFKIDLSAPRK